MELFNKSGVLISSILVLVGALIACQAKEDAVPPPTVVEAAAMQIPALGSAAAEHHLQEWADQGSAVAQRELALRYKADPARRSEAIHLFEKAARAGDAQAELGLISMYREANAVSGPDPINELHASRLMIKDVTGSGAPLYR